MSELTRSKVAYDLNISPHRLIMGYGSDKVEYVFSSELYRNKFIERFTENRLSINNSLSNRFGLLVDFPVLADMKLYVSIEKRGFLVIVNGEKITWRENLEITGYTLKKKN